MFRQIYCIILVKESYDVLRSLNHRGWLNQLLFGKCRIFFLLKVALEEGLVLLDEPVIGLVPSMPTKLT